MAAALLAAAGMIVTRVPDALKDGVLAAVPTPVLRFAAWCRQDRARALYESSPGRGVGPIGPAAPSGGPTTQLAIDWDRALIAWHAGRQLDLLAHGERTGSSVAQQQALLAVGLIQQAGANARIALPELACAVESDLWQSALSQINLLAILGNSEAVRALERAALHANRPEAGAQAAGQLAVVAATNQRHLHRIRRVIASERGPEFASTIARSIAPLAEPRWGKPASADHAALLNELLQDHRERVRFGGLQATRIMKDWTSVERSLTAFLESDPSPALRRRVAESACSWRVLTSAWGMPLVRACWDGDPNVAVAAVDALLQQATSQGWSMAEVAAWLATREAESPRVHSSRRDALRRVLAIVDRGDGNAPTLQTIRTLHRLAPGHPELLPTYIDWSLHHVSPAARAAAIDAVARLPGCTAPAALDLLERVLRSDSSPVVRIAAMQDPAVAASEDSRFLDLLADALDDAEPDVQMNAAAVLGVLARPHGRAESCLEELCRNSDNAMTRLAARSLDAMRRVRDKAASAPQEERRSAP